MTFGCTRAVALEGLSGAPVEVECHIGDGLPAFTVGGLPDTALRQSAERVRSSLVVLKQSVNQRRVMINLSPAAIPKHGTSYDVAIAVAVLASLRSMPQDACRGVTHLGELALDGRIRPVRGILPAVVAAAAHGFRHIVVPTANVGEARLVEGVRVSAFETLGELFDAYTALSGEATLPEAPPVPVSPAGERSQVDLADVAGQHEARVALEVAAAGGHHLMMSGPPGSGKTMLAERLVTILPRLSDAAALESLAVRSLLGAVDTKNGLDTTPPFIAPHHTATMAALIGGGSGQVLPGSISQAHHGVLFLDEAPEFAASVLQSLRQPLESGRVVIARARRSVTYPARFQLVLAANPCPCGMGFGKGLACRCRATERMAYGARLHGPLLDRVDIRIEVPPLTRSGLAAEVGERSSDVAQRVAQARAVQAERWGPSGWRLNSQVPGSVLRRRPWRLPPEETADLDRALDRGRITVRGYDRTLRTAWTVADLRGRTTPGRAELALGLMYRTAEGARR